MKRLVFISLCLLLVNHSFAQLCATSINNFPYNEGFEANDGAWVMGGTASDWQWGTPSKPVISGAGGGNKCWITGELAATSYNNGQYSWLTSPCFDFTGLTNPSISFKIFWETEQRFDGGSFQYSTNGGVAWMQLGTVNSNNNCQGSNWFNTPSVTYLTNINGWSGNIQPNNGSCLGGNGSNGWITARHTLNMLAGLPNVRFRFLFGAGTTCNNFDGFAVDDIRIEEVTAGPVSIVSTCLSNNRSEFSVTGGNCLTGHTWDFGDPASGTANSSVLPAPSHNFSAPGTYTVRVTTASGAGGSSTATKDVVVISASGSTNWPDPCSNIPSATLSVTATGSNTGYFYNWDTNPAQTGGSVTNIGPGIYNVTVNALNACATSVQYILSASSISNSVTVTNAKCVASNGTISSSPTGGTAPYTYTWSNGATGAVIQNLAPGTYSVEVKDAGGCSAKTENIIVSSEQAVVPVDIGSDMFICSNETLTLNPGNFSSYLWQDGSNGPVYSVTVPGDYSVQVTDVNGCTGSDAINIKFDCSDLYFPAAFSPDGNGINDGFGALGTQAAFAQNYKLNIYNRYGQLIFTSTNPLQKWNGTYKAGIPLSGSYVWMASYKLNGKERFRKGSILLLR